jgi:hypothetical protein
VRLLIDPGDWLAVLEKNHAGTFAVCVPLLGKFWIVLLFDGNKSGPVFVKKRVDGRRECRDGSSYRELAANRKSHSPRDSPLRRFFALKISSLI